MGWDKDEMHQNDITSINRQHIFLTTMSLLVACGNIDQYGMIHKQMSQKDLLLLIKTKY